MLAKLHFRGILPQLKNATPMKKTLLLILVLGATMLATAAEQYCHKQLTAGDKTVYATAKQVADNSYQLLIEADENLNGLGGSFIYVNDNEPYQLNTADHFVLAADKRSITCDITSTGAPKHYTPLYVLFENGGEKNFGQPDADYSKTCEGGSEGQGGAGGEGGQEGQGGGQDKPTGWDAIEWLGNGSGNAAYDQMYKIRLDEGQQVANIQAASWDNNNVGIYTWVESAVTSVSVASGIDGAGVLLHIDAFTMEYTEVTIVAATKTYRCVVYYKNGIACADPDDIESGFSDVQAAPRATKVLIDGKVLIIRGNERYTLIGTRVE